MIFMISNVHNEIYCSQILTRNYGTKPQLFAVASQDSFVRTWRDGGEKANMSRPGHFYRCRVFYLTLNVPCVAVVAKF